jgi:hypothetical protein
MTLDLLSRLDIKYVGIVIKHLLIGVLSIQIRSDQIVSDFENIIAEINVTVYECVESREQSTD